MFDAVSGSPGSAQLMRTDVLKWLLESNEPSVRYGVLTALLDKPETDPETEDEKRLLPRRGWASQILRAQQPGGYWDTLKVSPRNLYVPKFTATNWMLLVLSDLGLTAENPRVRKTCDLMLTQWGRRVPYGRDGGYHGHLCVTGNFTRALVLCGYGDDRRVRLAYDWLVKEQKPDGGWHCFKSGTGTLDGWEAMSAFSVLPKSKWSRSIRSSVERGAEFYLERELCKDGGRRYSPWFQFHYPVHYFYDLLVGLEFITGLGYGDDPRLRTALKVLEEKRRPDGTWSMGPIHPGKKPFALEKPREPSRWITFRALRVLKRVEESAPSILVK